MTISNNLTHELTLPSNRLNEQLANLTVQGVRQTCAAVANSPQCEIKIDHERARAVIDETPVDSITAASHLMAVDLKFPDEMHELNFHLLLHLFNFGHGFRHVLHDARGAGAWKTMKSGIERWYTESKGLIGIQELKAMDCDRAVKVFGLAGSEWIDKGSRCSSSVEALAEMIAQVASCTAEDLESVGDKTLAAFVDRNRIDPQSGRSSACRLVQQLATNFRGFRDQRQWRDGSDVVFLKKAQIAVAEVHQVMGSKLPAWQFDDVEQFTVVCDNVLPCVLRSLGVLQLPAELQDRIDHRRPLPAGPQEAELRACAIAASQTMLDRGDGRFWAKQLGDYLWTLGKRPDLRKVERHATTDTCFY